MNREKQMISLSLIFQLVGGELLNVVRRELERQNKWDSEVNSAWQHLIQFIVDAMKYGLARTHTTNRRHVRWNDDK